MGDLRDRVLRHAGARPAAPGETRTYEVRTGDDFRGTPVTGRIVVPAACPVVVGGKPCGLALGEPERRTLLDAHTGTEYAVTVPERHPCGHAVLHRDLITLAAKPLAEAS